MTHTTSGPPGIDPVFVSLNLRPRALLKANEHISLSIYIFMNGKTKLLADETRSIWSNCRDLNIHTQPQCSELQDGNARAFKFAAYGNRKQQ